MSALKFALKFALNCAQVHELPRISAPPDRPPRVVAQLIAISRTFSSAR